MLETTETTAENIKSWLQNFQHNARSSVESLQPRDYIRLIAIVGGYCLLRPYLIKLGGKQQAKDHERALDADETSSPAAVSPNTLRGQVDDMPEDSDNEEEIKPGSGVNWGQGTRSKQRRTLKQILEAEERKGAVEEADSDKEIEEFLQKAVQ